MDPITTAHVARAKSALSLALGGEGQRERAKAFVDAARAILRSGSGNMLKALADSPNSLVSKAAAHLVLDDEWDTASGEMAAAFLETVAEHSIIDLLKRYGRALPAQARSVVIASDAVGDMVVEGGVKPVKHLDLNQAAVEPIKTVGMVILSEELANATDAEALFEHELRAAVARASNASILSALTDSDTTTITGNADPLNNLRLGLAAAAPSHGYVIAMPSGAVAALATCVENKGGMGVRGGTFVPGVEVIAIDDADEIVVIPSTRIALWDGGLKLRSARHATVDLRDDPEAEPKRVNLWQNNLRGLLLERSWALASADGVVIVESGG